MPTLIIATRNSHKVQEIRAILGEEITFLTLSAFPGAPDVIEDAPTFEGNATKKAVELGRWIASSPDAQKLLLEETLVLADDSGLEVDALNGAPGVHSARFAALDTGLSGNSSDADNKAKLLRLMQSIPAEQRTARFRCVIALTPILPSHAEPKSPVCYADQLELATRLFEGTCEGRIGFEPTGEGGFGYDPLFIPDGFSETFAELGETTKNQISHRAKALAGVKPAVFT
jgi:XTP/dITP diphosphohydrolase